jgi:hypothetical protein
MSTPRTDNFGSPKHGYVAVEFARKLERELNMLRAFVQEVANDKYAHVSPSMKEKAREVLARIS